MSIANPHLYGHDSLSQEDLRLKRRATVASIAVAFILISTKLFAFFTTNSVSLLSSLMDSCFDFLASAIAFFSVAQAAVPADSNHRFGHGKVEALGALGQAVFVFGTSIFLLVESARRFISPQPVEEPATGIAVMLLSIGLTFCLLLYQRHVIRRTQSVAVTADSLHYKGDLMMNLSVLAALGLTYYSGWPYFDPLFATAIAFALLWGAYSIVRESFDILMDKELPAEDREKIMAIVRAHPAAVSVHDLRTRSTGERVFIEFHVELDGAMTLNRAHDITEDIERLLYAAFPKSEVLMHQEPAGIEDHRLDDSIEQQEKQDQSV